MTEVRGWKISSMQPPEWADSAMLLKFQGRPVALVAFSQTSLCPPIFYVGLQPKSALTASRSRVLKQAVDYLLAGTYAIKAAAMDRRGARFLEFLGFVWNDEDGYHWRR